MLDRRLLIGAAASMGIIPADGATTDHALSASDRLNQFGPEANLLSRRVGLWIVTETSWPSLGEQPIKVTRMVAERMMIGSMLQEFLRPNNDKSLKSIRRTDLLSFNRLDGRWGYVSFDTREPAGLMPAWSSDHGNLGKIAFLFEPFALPGAGKEATGQMVRMEQILTFKDADHDIKDHYVTAADGTGVKRLVHQLSYSRQI